MEHASPGLRIADEGGYNLRSARTDRTHVFLEIHHSQRVWNCLGQSVWVNPAHPLYAWWIATVSKIHVLRIAGVE